MDVMGFDRRQHEKQTDYPENFKTREYIAVKASMNKDKSIIPCSIFWEDEEYKITKILSIKEGKSLKDAIKGYVYKCRIGMKEFILVFDGEKWYIEI